MHHPSSDSTPAVTRVEPRFERDWRGTQCIDSGQLLGNDREILIMHADQAYRLRLTCNDKLILTK